MIVTFGGPDQEANRQRLRNDGNAFARWMADTPELWDDDVPRSPHPHQGELFGDEGIDLATRNRRELIAMLRAMLADLDAAFNGTGPTMPLVEPVGSAITHQPNGVKNDGQAQ